MGKREMEPHPETTARPTGYESAAGSLIAFTLPFSSNGLST